MKDINENELRINDTVAIIYHPRAYVFSIEAAVITGFKGKTNMIVTRLVNKEASASFMSDKTGDLYRKVVKISPDFPDTESDKKVDAVGHELHVGDRIVCRRPSEAGGNTVKGFEKGGTIEKITDKFVIYTDEVTGEKKRKGLNGIVVF